MVTRCTIRNSITDNDRYADCVRIYRIAAQVYQIRIHIDYGYSHQCFAYISVWTPKFGWKRVIEMLPEEVYPESIGVARCFDLLSDKLSKMAYEVMK